MSEVITITEAQRFVLTHNEIYGRLDQMRQQVNKELNALRADAEREAVSIINIDGRTRGESMDILEFADGSKVIMDEYNLYLEDEI